MQSVLALDVVVVVVVVVVAAYEISYEPGISLVFSSASLLTWKLMDNTHRSEILIHTMDASHRFQYPPYLQ